MALVVVDWWWWGCGGAELKEVKARGLKLKNLNEGRPKNKLEFCLRTHVYWEADDEGLVLYAMHTVLETSIVLGNLCWEV